MTEPRTASRKAYPSDLMDEQWVIIQPLLPAAKLGGRRREVDLREVMNSILYLNRTGCQWDMLPHDLLPKSTVYEYFKAWNNDGTLTKAVATLRAQLRVREGREPTPSAACIDTQSVKTTEVGGPDRGYDGGKKIKGRKRHLLVDTLGLLVAVVVTAANLDDGTAAPKLLARVTAEELPRLEVIFRRQQILQSFLERLAGQKPIDVADRSAIATTGHQRLSGGSQTLGRGADQCLEWPLAPQQ